MRLLYCIAGIYNCGGMERVLSIKANYFIKQGHEVTIVTTDQCGRKPFFKFDDRIKIIDLNIGYEDNNGKSFFNKLVHFPFKQIRHKSRLCKVLNEVKPDIAISMFCNDASILSKINDGSKKILEVHFSRFKRLQYNRTGFWRLADIWRNKWDLRIASRYDRFVVLTHEDANYWQGLKNLVVIPNAQIYTCEVPASLDNNIVLSVGRYTYQKGFDLLLDAWALVCKHINSWQLHIWGDGELRGAMVEQIKRLSLENSVKLFYPTTDMKSVYKEASIFVMPSRYEGFGLVLLEAQSFGLPVVSFNCKCGPSEIVEDGVSGYLVEENNIRDLAEHLLVLMKDKSLRQHIGKNAFVASSSFSVDSIMKKWNTLFDEITRK